MIKIRIDERLMLTLLFCFQLQSLLTRLPQSELTGSPVVPVTTLSFTSTKKITTYVFTVSTTSRTFPPFTFPPPVSSSSSSSQGSSTVSLTVSCVDRGLLSFYSLSGQTEFVLRASFIMVYQPFS